MGASLSQEARIDRRMRCTNQAAGDDGRARVAAPELSVVICTFDRAAILRDTLDSFYAMPGSRDAEVELWIIDNRSSDRTAELVAEYARGACNLHYAFEARPGLSHARNAGAAHARGDLVAYVDDDVFFAPGWLAAVRRTFDRQPQIAAMGGRSIPRFEKPRPAWIPDELLGIYGSTRSGEHEKVMGFPEHPFGLNMVFRRQTLQQIGEFNTALGRKRNDLLSSEELEYFLRIARAGLVVLYAPDALLHHRIPAERMSRRWIRSRYCWQGISDAIVAQLQEPQSRRALLTSARREIGRLISDVREDRKRPLEIWQHFRGLPFPTRLHHLRRFGRIIGALRLACTMRR